MSFWGWSLGSKRTQALPESRLYIYFTPFDVPVSFSLSLPLSSFYFSFFFILFPSLLRFSSPSLVPLPPFALRFAVARVARRTAGNKWPLMDFLDVCARAAELRCSQAGSRKYGGTLNYRNRCLSLFLLYSISLALSISVPLFRSADHSCATLSRMKSFHRRPHGRVVVCACSWRTFHLRQ